MSASYADPDGTTPDPEALRLDMIDATLSGRDAARLLVRKGLRRLLRRGPGLQPVAAHNGLVVFHQAHLHGGGLAPYAENFLRVLLEHGQARCQRLSEFCAGPGYIGYHLLANGFCESLCLADINPEAVDAARATARFNRLEARVAVYQADCFEGIPSSERWDVVVGNPPMVPMPLTRQDPEPERALVVCDPDWTLRRRFYADVRRFLKPGGLVLMAEKHEHSSPATFEPMIVAAGGRIVAVEPDTDPAGRDRGEYYFVLSRW